MTPLPNSSPIFSSAQRIWISWRNQRRSCSGVAPSRKRGSRKRNGSASAPRWKASEFIGSSLPPVELADGTADIGDLRVRERRVHRKEKTAFEETVGGRQVKLRKAKAFEL